MAYKVSYTAALRILDNFGKLPAKVTVNVVESKEFPNYNVESLYCFVILVHGIMLFATDTSMHRLEYFVDKAGKFAKLL